MQIDHLIPGFFIKRYKRFFIEVQLTDGTLVIAHSNNTGSMRSVLYDNAPVWLEFHDNPKRKLPYTLHLIQLSTGGYVCVNTLFPNRLVEEAIGQDKIPELCPAEMLRHEIPYGQENSRIDLYLRHLGTPTFVEVKNVTLMEPDLPQVAQFPDAITERGQKHLRELIHTKKSGNRAVMFYLISRTDCHSFQSAAHIDPHYATLLDQAVEAGVEVYAYQLSISFQPHSVRLMVTHRVPYLAKGLVCAI